MKKILFFVSLLILTTINVIAQKWVTKDYKNEWGDPSGKRITQEVDGFITYYGPNNPDLVQLNTEVKVEISRYIPSLDNFEIKAYLNGRYYDYVSEPNYYKFKKPLTKKEIRQNISTVGRETIDERKWLFRYKIGEKESSFYILDPHGINYSEFNSILLSTSLPIKCVITEESTYFGKDISSNLIRFTLYPANYKQLVQ